jgi:hypothetical protein
MSSSGREQIGLHEAKTPVSIREEPHQPTGCAQRRSVLDFKVILSSPSGECKSPKDPTRYIQGFPATFGELARCSTTT